MSALPSLLLGDPAQPPLFSSAQMPDAVFFKRESTLGEFTGERFASRRPEDYRLCVAMLAEGLHIIQIARLLKVSPKTIRAVEEREGLPIAQEKEKLSRLAHHGARLAFEGVVEDLSDEKRRAKIHPRDKAIIGSILVDKGQLLAGEATSREELIHTAPQHQDYNDYIAGLKRTGSGAETLGQKGSTATPGATPATPAVIDLEPVAAPPPTDSEST